MRTKYLPTQYIKTRRQYILFENDCGVSDVARWGGIYEPYIFSYITKNLQVENTTIIDIGANFGFHALEFAEVVGDNGKVFAFEPQRLVYYQLCGNVILNGLDNVQCYNIALGNREGTIELENQNYYAKDKINIGDTHSEKFTHNAKETVPVRTLDSYQISNVSIIKLDVQGYEPYVIDGMKTTIQTYKPHIFIEIDSGQLSFYGFTDNDVFNRLTALGYTIQRMHPDAHIVDYVAVPQI